MNNPDWQTPAHLKRHIEGFVVGLPDEDAERFVREAVSLYLEDIRRRAQSGEVEDLTLEKREPPPGW